MSTSSSSSISPDNQSTLSAPDSSTSSSKANNESLVLLKGKDGSIVAKGTVFPHRNTIHGHPCSEDCQIVSVGEVVQSGAQLWFEDRYNEELTKSIFVEWPKQMICFSVCANCVKKTVVVCCCFFELLFIYLFVNLFCLYIYFLTMGEKVNDFDFFLKCLTGIGKRERWIVGTYT